MLIVFEGADGAGKTTLAKKIAAQLNVHYYHSGGPKTKREMENVLMDLEDMSLSKDIHLVDRHPGISEIVYTKVLDKELCIPLKFLVDSWHDIRLLVHCVCPKADYSIDEGFKSHKSKEHLEAVKKRHNRILDHYETLMDETFIPSMRVNTRDKENVNRLIEKIRILRYV